MTLSVRFSIDRNAFRLAVDLALPTTGITAIFGPSGSGKTTLLRAIAGLERIPDASIRFDDAIWQDSTQFVPVHERRIGYVFQEPSLFAHLSVAQNIAYGLQRTSTAERRIALEQAIDLLGIHHLLPRFSATLSGGEQQRVAIARTLAASPRLLLMDEPLSSLDQKRKLEILPYLESLHRELALPVLYVSHATDEVARLADSLVILRNGEILGHGPIQQMLTRLDLPLSHRSDAETLLNATVSTAKSQFGMMQVSTEGHDFWVTAENLAPGTDVRLRISALDVSLTLVHQGGTSIQNIFPVTVSELIAETEAQVMVKILLGDSPLLARVTRKSVEELGITPGKNLFAQIKGVAVLA